MVNALFVLSHTTSNTHPHTHVTLTPTHKTLTIHPPTHKPFTHTPTHTHREIEALVDQQAVPEKGTQPLEQLPNRKVGFGVQLRMLLWRFNVVYWRAPQYTLFRVFLTILIVRCCCWW